MLDSSKTYPENFV